jgi:hypothetical protein
VQTVLKSGSLNLQESSAPFQACNGIALPLPLLEVVESSSGNINGINASKHTSFWDGGKAA